MPRGHPFSLSAKKRGKETFLGGFSTAPFVPERKMIATRPLCSGLARHNALRSAHGAAGTNILFRAPARHPSNKGTPLDPVGWKQWIFRFKTAFAETIGISGLRGRAPYRWGWARRDSGECLYRLRLRANRQRRLPKANGAAGFLQTLWRRARGRPKRPP